MKSTRWTAIVLAIAVVFGGFAPISAEVTPRGTHKKQYKKKRTVKKKEAVAKNAGAMQLNGTLTTVGTGNNQKAVIKVPVNLSPDGKVTLYGTDASGNKYEISAPVSPAADSSEMVIPVAAAAGIAKSMPESVEQRKPDNNFVPSDPEKPCVGKSTQWIAGGTLIGGACAGLSVTGAGGLLCYGVAILVTWHGIEKNDSKPICEVAAGVIGVGAGYYGGLALAPKKAAASAVATTTTTSAPPPGAP